MFGTPGTRAEVFKRPYPPTSFIEAPTHDQTSLQFCLNLPRAEFDSTEIIVRPVAATAPVGSSTWITLKGLQPPRKDIPDTKEVEFNDTSKLQTENQMEPVNLWAEADGKDPIPVLSDLPSMSTVGDDESGICPFHGLSCKKMCAWRTEYQRKRGPKVGGPSNVKNYNPRPPKAGPKSPVGKTDRTLASVSGNQNYKAPARAPPPPLHIMTARGGGRGITSVSPSTSSPNAASPISDGSPTGPIATHQVSPPVRGTPVWASRGRGRGRGSS
ncbi:hypothetical protein FRC17_001734 [Serendipita sp. 399]|nr:hypothetical protein FRC17_001734 [Serendipita sp. 399]